MSDNERKEVLDQQLQLLAEKSKSADVLKLQELTQAMCEVYRTLMTR